MKTIKDLDDAHKAAMKQFSDELDRYMFTDGFGTLDSIKRQHFWSRNRFSVCAANCFFPGQTVQVYSPTGALRGDAVIGVVAQTVRFLFTWRSGYLEFSSWPKGTRGGDFVVLQS